MAAPRVAASNVLPIEREWKEAAVWAGWDSRAFRGEGGEADLNVGSWWIKSDSSYRLRHCRLGPIWHLAWRKLGESEDQRPSVGGEERVRVLHRVRQAIKREKPDGRW